MASNFTIRHHRREGCLHLKLGGDFDGSAAFELNHCLQNALDQDPRVIVHTDRLSSLPAFGRDMFQKQFGSRSQIAARVIFTGAYAPEIAPEGCPTLG
ncbi:MAG: hypothetical protein JJV98_14495 [Desulfosarcina sp.]|nr:hypothetical protein [Desulfobacterales bacterium]